MVEPAVEPIGAGFSVEVDFSRRVIRPTGELDIATSGLLLEAARSMGDESADLTVDCADLSLISSSGLNAFVAISTAQHDRHADLFLVNVSTLVKRRLITGGCANLL